MRPGRAAGRAIRAAHIRLKPGTNAAWAGALVAASPDTCVIDVPRDDEALVYALRAGSGPVEDAVAREDGSR